MAFLLWGMRRFVIRYSVEFFVLFTGLLLTFYIEDLNQHRHKVELKDQSLSRLIKNVEDDVTDLTINLFKIQSAIDYWKVLADSSDVFFEHDKDTLGYYLTAMSRTSTIFYANQEEYVTLRNSGYLELIEHDSLVNYLQKRQSSYNAFKKVEDKIIQYEQKIVDLVNAKTGLEELGSIEFAGYDHGMYASYVHDAPLTRGELNMLGYKADQNRFYKPLILEAIRNDSILIDLIQREIKHLD